jgi:DNA repair protein RadC
MHDGVRERLVRTKLGEDREALCSYLLVTMQNLSDERMLAIFADAEGFVIAEEVIAQGNDAQVLITPRRIFGRALNLDARRILLAHNHPSGSPEPSPFDIKHTSQLCRQARELGLEIEDHLIVGCRQVSSMKDRGLI